MHGTVRDSDERNVVGRVKIWARIICVFPRARSRERWNAKSLEKEKEEGRVAVTSGEGGRSLAESPPIAIPGPTGAQSRSISRTHARSISRSYVQWSASMLHSANPSFRCFEEIRWGKARWRDIFWSCTRKKWYCIQRRPWRQEGQDGPFTPTPGISKKHLLFF